MKKIIIFLALLLSVVCKSQVVINRSSVSNFTCSNIASISFASFTFFANTLYIVVTMVDSCNNYGTISGGTTTWDSLAAVKTGSTGNSRRMKIWRGVPTTNETVGLTLNCTNCRGARFEVYIVEHAPVTNNGADAIKQVKIDSAAAGTDPTLTFDTGVKGSNGLMFFLRTTTNPPGGTPEANQGNIEQFDTGCTYGGVNTGNYMMYANRTKDSSPSITAASSDWVGIAIEFAGRRIFTTK